MARIAKEKKGSNKNNKKRVNKSKNKEVRKISNDLFSFDDEMIIGVNKKEDKKVNKDEAINTKKNNNKKNTNNKKRNNNKNKNKKSDKKPNKINIKNKVSEEDIEKYYKKRRMNLKIIKYISIVILFIILIVVTMFSPIFNIKNIVVEGNEKIAENEILSLSGLILGENIYKTSKNRIKENIKENPYIEDVIIKRKLPSQLQITVIERKATFMIEYGASFVYIDNQGYILEINTEKIEIPILQGIQTESENFVVGERLTNNDLQKMNTVLKIMEISQSNDIANLITRIDIENEQDYKISLETKEKIIYLGDNSNLNTKILNAKAILEKTEGVAGEIFVNMDLNNEYPIFRQRV